MSKEPTLPKARYYFRIIVSTVAAIFLLSALAALALTKQRPAVRLPINDELSFTLIGVLTKESPDFPTRRSWQWVVFNKLPSSLQTLYDKFLLQPAAPTAPIKYSSLGDSSARFIFQLDRQPGSVDANPQTDIERKVETALKEAGIHRVRISYGQGWYSGGEPVNAQIFFGDKTGAVYIEAAFQRIPKTERFLDLQFTGPLDDKQDTVIASLRVDNPVYKKFTPLSTPQKLPATVSINNVSVTLHALVSKTIPVSEPRPDEQGNEMYKLAEKLKFLQAAGTPNDSYHSTTAFAISEPGTTSSQWALTNVTFLYGEGLEELSPYMRAGPVSVRSPSGQGMKLVSFLPDVGVLKQPVKVQVKLVRDGKYPPDELQKLELSLPAKGSVSGPEVVRGLWDGPVSVGVANEANLKMKKLSSSGRPGSLAIGIDGNSPHLKLVDVKLLREDITLDIKNYGGASAYSVNSIEYVYDFKNWNRMSSLGPVTLTDFTTISLTIASPRVIDQPFEFIVMPEEASIPAVPKRS